jgi:hypothetical protein
MEAAMKTPQQRLTSDVAHRVSALMHYKRMEYSQAVHQARLDILRSDAVQLGHEEFRRAAMKMFLDLGNPAAAEAVRQMYVYWETDGAIKKTGENNAQ